MDYWKEKQFTQDSQHRDGKSIGRPDSGQFVVFSTTPPYRARPIYTAFTTRTTTRNKDELYTLQCDRFDMQYNIIPAVICCLCFVFGILYCFFGYRYFKATMFMTGFIFGSLVTYIICLEENLLPLEGKIGVAIGAGILCGLITMLVQYVGLFMTGFHLGLLLAVAGLVITEWFVHPNTKWVPIGAVFGTGLIFALLCLYFQKSLTMLSTSILGSAMMAVAVDHFVERFTMMNFVLDRLKAVKSDPVCWFSWIILGLWPMAALLGSIAQCQLTGKGYNHHEVVVNRRRHKLSQQRTKEHSGNGSGGSHQSRPSNYRHLYQIRRFNGDIIAQNYVCRVHENPTRVTGH